MHNAIVAVTALSTEQQFAVACIEGRTPLDELSDVAWRFADHHFDDFLVAQVGSGGKRIGNVVLESVVGAQYAGNSTLSVGAVRFGQFVLGDDQSGQLRIDSHRRPQPGYPSPDH